jgi:hypothetical protein
MPSYSMEAVEGEHHRIFHCHISQTSPIPNCTPIILNPPLLSLFRCIANVGVGTSLFEGAFSSSLRRNQHNQRKLHIPLRRHSTRTLRGDKHRGNHYHPFFVLLVLVGPDYMVPCLAAVGTEGRHIAAGHIAAGHRLEADIVERGIAGEGIAEVVLRRSTVGSTSWRLDESRR